MFVFQHKLVRMITFLAGRIKKPDLIEDERFCLVSGQHFNESAKCYCEKVVEKWLFSLRNDSILRFDLKIQICYFVNQFSAFVFYLFLMICKHF